MQVAKNRDDVIYGKMGAEFAGALLIPYAGAYLGMAMEGVASRPARNYAAIL